MRAKKLFLLVFLVPIFAFNAHKFYLSLTQIEYNEKNKSIEIIINVFIDDLETTLNKLHDKEFELDTKKELKDADTYFFKYLQNNVKLKIDGKSVSYNYIGKEYDGDVVFFYLEVTDINSVQEIDINNTLLLEHFPDQQNLIKSKVQKKHKSLMLTNKEQSGIIKY